MPSRGMLPIDCQYFHTEMARITSPIEYPAARTVFTC